MSPSVIFDGLRHCALALALLCLLSACGTSTVQVEGDFPAPVMEPLPITIGVWMADEFRNHEFFDEAKTKGKRSWSVQTGKAQTSMWDALLTGMFRSLVYLDAEPVAGEATADVDGILVPRVDELQYAIPATTNIKVYEVWMRYKFQLLSADGDTVAEWTMSSYGKTPTAFLQSDEAAVNLAAVMALRDAGANFATNFTKVPAVSDWLQTLDYAPAGPAP
ncbi:MAG: hypothetical protein R3228_02435 [Halioglobus sp.]|nr:hypothetical protein [Halioglobus sp.]